MVIFITKPCVFGAKIISQGIFLTFQVKVPCLLANIVE